MKKNAPIVNSIACIDAPTILFHQAFSFYFFINIITTTKETN